MLQRWIFGRQKHASKAARQKALSTYVSTSQDFRTIIEIDRLRADRLGMSIAFVIFSVDDETSDEQVFKFADRLKCRLRTTDHSGMLSENQFGIVLWDTDAKGAMIFVNSVREANPRIDFTHDIYVYPTRVACQALQIDDPIPQRKESSSDDSSDSDKDQRNQEPPSSEDDSGDQSPEQDVLDQVQSLEDLLKKKPSKVKRLVDIIGACVGLTLASPILLAAAAAIKIFDPGPIFFKQKRSGFNGKSFTIYKLRTMVVDAEARKAALRKISEQDGAAFKLTHDPRVTWVGRFLRKTSIDELPQLWNVLIGDMSLVGPRPLPCDEARACDGWQQQRLDVLPGLTCIWQIHGRSRVTFAEWMRMDLRYIRSRSVLSDIRLIMETVPAVLMRRGAK